MAKSQGFSSYPRAVRAMIEVGVRIPTAIREAIGMTDTAFALKHKRNRQNVASLLNGKRAPTDKDIAALIAECGGTPDEWRNLFFEASRPDSAKVAV
jgi:plasmid maintenance system antidote protein VapI